MRWNIIAFLNTEPVKHTLLTFSPIDIMFESDPSNLMNDTNDESKFHADKLNCICKLTHTHTHERNLGTQQKPFYTHHSCWNEALHWNWFVSIKMKLIHSVTWIKQITYNVCFIDGFSLFNFQHFSQFSLPFHHKVSLISFHFNICLFSLINFEWFWYIWNFQIVSLKENVEKFRYYEE